MNSIFMKLCHMTKVTKVTYIPQKFEVIFADFTLMKNIIFNKTKSFVVRGTLVTMPSKVTETVSLVKKKNLLLLIRKLQQIRTRDMYF